MARHHWRQTLAEADFRIERLEIVELVQLQHTLHGFAAHRRKPAYAFMADQLAAPQLKMYNPESQIKTPNLDRRAAGSAVIKGAANSFFTGKPVLAAEE